MSTDQDPNKNDVSQPETEKSNQKDETPPPEEEASETNASDVDQSMCDRAFDMKYYNLY